MIQAKNKTINGHEYTVTQFPAMHGLRMAVRLFKVVGPGLGKALSAGSLTDLMSKDLGDGSLGDAISALVGNLDADGTPQMILDLLSSTHRDRREMTQNEFNTAYAANYGELIEALKFVLEVNYGGFFGALAAGDIGSPTAAV